MQKLSVKGLAVAVGAAWALLMLALGLGAMFGWGVKFLEAMSSIYIGFAPTFPGILIGVAWGFLDGAIAGAIVAFVYNAVVSRK